MLKVVGYVVVFILFLWLVLTIIAQVKGPAASEFIGDESDSKYKAIAIYDPDPFYNLDYQVCAGIGEGLSEHGWHTEVHTVRAAEQIEAFDYDLVILCANTYNWAPDRAISNFIQKTNHINNASVLSITLGGGSTKRAQRLLDEMIEAKGGNLINTNTLWLWRPNDESRMSESNVTVAVDLAKDLGKKVAASFLK